MKKLLMMFLSVLLLIGFTGCGNKESAVDSLKGDWESDFFDISIKEHGDNLIFDIDSHGESVKEEFKITDVDGDTIKAEIVDSDLEDGGDIGLKFTFLIQDKDTLVIKVEGEDSYTLVKAD